MVVCPNSVTCSGLPVSSFMAVEEVGGGSGGGGIKWDVSSGRVAETDSNNIALKSCNATRSP